MSNVNIKRAVENIRSGTNAYTPLVEVVVNAIQAIESTENKDGLVEIVVHRSTQSDLLDAIPEVTGFTVRDSGIGFNEVNREAFDTLYTTHKVREGGKGFGRFTCLKYFTDVEFDSVFFNGTEYRGRTFKMGKDTELIVDERIGPTEQRETGTVVRLLSITKAFPDKSIPVIARSLVEKLLPYFVSENRECPRITLQEANSTERVILNDYIGGADDSLIVEDKEASGEFSLSTSTGAKKQFFAKVFKLYSAKGRRSKISLVAHRREVVSTSLHLYIPEFFEEFYDEIQINGIATPRNFIVAVYVFGGYLDDNVSVERAGFEFHKDADLLLGISQREIESAAAKHARGPVEAEVRNRQQRKAERVREYVRDKAPWHSVAVRDADLSMVPYGATDEDIELYLYRDKFSKEVQTRESVRQLLKSEAHGTLGDKVADIVREVSESSRSELVHYVALRRSVLDIFERILQREADGTYSAEGVVHDVIFPRKGDSDTTPFGDHNLWIVNESLNFTEYLSSDLPMFEQTGDRPDLLAFDRRIGFRGSNEASNPVTIFEFKKPDRDDFVNPSSKEDPVQQIIRYVLQIKAGKYRTPKGREIQVAENTPFYGYVVCDLTPKVREWLEGEKDFKPMPDRMGYFKWHDNLNLYLEVLGWDKIHKDALIRNKVFFHKLGIE